MGPDPLALEDRVAHLDSFASVRPCPKSQHIPSGARDIQTQAMPAMIPTISLSKLPASVVDRLFSGSSRVSSLVLVSFALLGKDVATGLFPTDFNMVPGRQSRQGSMEIELRRNMSLG